MLRSMTGFGSGEATVGDVTATTEVRSVNHRGLKLSVRLSPTHGRIETQLEKLGKELIRRGSVQLQVKVTEAGWAGQDVRSEVNAAQVAAYFEAAQTAARQADIEPPHDITPFLVLPGALTTREVQFDEADLEAAVVESVRAAVEALDVFRRVEGEALAGDMLTQIAVIRESLATVDERAPQVVEEYRERIQSRLGEILARNEIELPEETIIREVAVFADRADVNEEISRLTCHLDQFEAIVGSEDVEGRKLDFLCQEMFREINTIGSKANDIVLSQTVVDMKAAAEKVREQVQNVE